MYLMTVRDQFQV